MGKFSLREQTNITCWADRSSRPRKSSRVLQPWLHQASAPFSPVPHTVENCAGTSEISAYTTIQAAASLANFRLLWRTH